MTGDSIAQHLHPFTDAWEREVPLGMPDRELWIACRRGDCAARNALVEKHTRFVDVAAKGMVRRLTSYADYDDLWGAGVFGLIRAVERFDLTAGTDFGVYALACIRGEILDSLRKQDWAPRSVRKSVTDVTKAEQALGPGATPASVAEHLGRDVEWVGQVKAGAKKAQVSSWEATLEYGEKSSGGAEDIGGTVILRLAGSWLARRPELDQQVVTLRYYHGLSLVEVAKVLDVPAAAVTRCHTQVLLGLRDFVLSQLGEDEVPSGS